MKRTERPTLPPASLLITAMLCALVAGCKPGASSTQSGGGAGANRTVDVSKYPPAEPSLEADCAPGIPGGRLILSTFGGDAKTLNPITENEGSSSDITRFLFFPLVNFDWATQKSRPGLAYKWEVDEAGTTWTWHMRKDLKWSDGHPLTADDVIFTFEAVYDSRWPNPTADALMVDKKPFVITKVDDLTFTVFTHRTYAPFEEGFGMTPILPKHVLEQSVKDGKFESAYSVTTPPDQYVCNGPFKLKQIKPGEFTLLERNPYFPMVDSKGQRLPYVDEVIYMAVPDLNAMSLRFLAGESHALETVRADEYVKFKAQADQGKFALNELGVGPEKAFFWFNMNTENNPKTGKPHVEPKKLKWFREVKFRQAVSHAVDRNSIIKSVYAGRAEALFGFVSPANKNWYNPNTPDYPFDQARARALLKEIGIEDRNGDGVLEDREGNNIEFNLHTNTGNNERTQICVLIQEDLKRLGMKVNFQPLDFNTLIDKIDVSYDYDCMLLSLGGGVMDPAGSANVLLSSGFTHFWFPKQKTPSTPWEARIDELMNEQITILDHEKRKKVYDEVQVIMAEQVPFIYTVSRYSYAAIRSDIGNLRPTALSYWRLTWNAEELYFKK